MIYCKTLQRLLINYVLNLSLSTATKNPNSSFVFRLFFSLFASVFFVQFFFYFRSLNNEKERIIMTSIKRYLYRKRLNDMAQNSTYWSLLGNLQWITFISMKILPKKNLEFMKNFPDKKKPQMPIKISSSCFTRRGRLLIKHKFRNNKSSFNGRLCSYTLSCSFFSPPWKAILEHLFFKLHFYLIFVCIYTI